MMTPRALNLDNETRKIMNSLREHKKLFQGRG